MQLDPSFDRHVTQVDGARAEALVAEGARVLDVRTPPEFTDLGHIPGAWLLPVHLAASAPALFDDPDAPVIVTCEHAVRSRVAARVLAQAGFTRVHELAHGMAGWSGPRGHEPAPLSGPSPWLLDCGDLLPRSGTALDVASGRGRHALLLASAGLHVTAIDRDEAALARLQTQAEPIGLPVTTRVADLEAGSPSLGDDGYDVVVVTRYLHRPLFPQLLLSLAPGGLLIYETFLEVPQERAGLADAPQGRRPSQPTRADFLLKPGELDTLVAPLRVLRRFEGERDGQWVSAIAARR